MTTTAASGPLRLLGVDAAAYQPHRIHGEDRIWSETNCYVDVWFELLHALGAEPVAAAAFTLSSDFEDPQWSFFKPSAEDLRRAFGLEVAEINVWRPVLDHVEEQLALGRLLTVEVDSWWLPDTAGVSYRIEHTKTTIVPESVDRAAATLGYFHGSGYHVLHGEDFDGVFSRTGLPPYAELIRLDRFDPEPADLLERAVWLGREHLARRPADNPARRLAGRLERAASWLQDQDAATFHAFAFGTCRQCGANAELAASWCRWMAGHGDAAAGWAAEHFSAVAEDAKALQFALARAARGRAVDLGEISMRMADGWGRAMAALDTSDLLAPGAASAPGPLPAPGSYS